MRFSDKELFKKEFKKLPQLDRIELRQRMLINDGMVKNPLFAISKYYFIGGIMLLLYSILIAPSYGDALFFKFFEIGINAVKIGVLFFCLEYCALFYILFKSNKEKKKILKEYFPKLCGDKN